MRRAFLLCVAVVLVSATVSVGVAQAASCPKTVAVHDPGDTGSRGQLRKAIADVCDGGKIIVRPGLVVGLQQGELAIPSGKTITILNPSQGQSPGVTIDGHGASRVLRVDSGADLTIERLTIQGGSADWGGGILNQGTLSLAQSTVSANTGTIGGGGISNSGTVHLYNSSVGGNRTSFGVDIEPICNAGPCGGGGIYNSGTVYLHDSSVSLNSVGTFSRGGGISNDGDVYLYDSSSISLNSNSDFIGGSAGGVYNSGAVYLYDTSSIRGNSPGTDFQGGPGGGILNVGAVYLYDSSSITGNRCLRSVGGGIANFFGSVNLYDTSSISGNVAAAGVGGGIYNFFGSVNLHDSSSIPGNTSFGSVGPRSGGGISNDGGTVSGCNSTGVDQWTGAISPNIPDDPPTVNLVTCT